MAAPELAQPAATMHKLLERQLVRHFGSLDAVPGDLRAFLESVDRSYRDADDGRLLVERSLELTSQELNEVNSGLRAEVERRGRNEALQRAILESALDCIILMDGQGMVREFNPAAQRTFGYSRDEAVGRQLADIMIPSALRERHRAGLARFLQTGDGPVLHKRIEIEGMRKDGSIFPVELAIIPFRQGPEHMFAGYLRDISERVRSARELERRNATVQLLQQVPLVASEAPTVEAAAKVCLDRICEYTGWPVGHAYFWQPLPESPLGALVSRRVWHMDQPARYDAFRQLTEATAFRWGLGLPGRCWKTAKPAWILDLAKDGNFPRAPAATQGGLHSGFGFPVLIHGKVLAVLEFFSPLPQAPDDELLQTLASLGAQLGSVLDRKRSEEQLRDAYERLQQVDRERTQFLNNAAHELGTPLTPIKLQVQLLKSRLGVTEAESQSKRSVDILERNVERLGHLVKDLLDSARLQTGQMRLQPEPTDLAEILRTACEVYREMAAAGGVQLECAPMPAMRVLADPARLGQVFDNLLSNAIKFTPDGGRIAIEAAERNGMAVVNVRDSGIGLTPEAMSRLFRPFAQVHDTMEQSRPGTGLGLYICKGIVEGGGGRLHCSSPGPGHGSCFTVELPLLKQS